MTEVQKIIKYVAMAVALCLAVSIIGGIVGGVAILGGILDGSATTDDLTTYEISSPITALDIEIGAADFTIKEGDSFSVESNLKNLIVKEKNGTLIIEEKTFFGGTYNGAVLTLYLPFHEFEKAEIATGAGRFTVDSLNAKNLDLELGAGEVNIDHIWALTADIDGGAGKLTIDGGTLNNLDLDMGIGQLNLNVESFGESELDLGVGESNITLRGGAKYYTVNIEKGIGSITVDGKSVSSYARAGNGQSRIQINGGVGSIHLNFVD